MTVYVDTDALKASLTLAGTTYADDDLDAVAAAASGAIEQAQGRTYGKSGTDETRFFASVAKGPLYIDDLAALTSVRVDYAGAAEWQDWTLNEHFALGPSNASLLRQPYTHLTSLAGHYFPRGRFGMVEVVGKFGWPAVPPQITEAATLLATQLVRRRRDTPFPVLAIGEVAAYITRTDPQISALLNGLSRRALFV